MAQEGWEQRLTTSVAAQVRRYRRQRKMSAQDLSDRCTELGMPIARPVLSNLENGRRESVTLAELLVLAAALEVSPTALVTPVDTEPTMEILPGCEVGTDEILQWFDGNKRFVATEAGLEVRRVDWLEDLGPDLDRNEPASYLNLYWHHRVVADSILADMAVQELTEGTVKVEVPVEPGFDGAAGELLVVRNTIRELGLRVPELPPALSFLDPPEPSREELRKRMQDRMRDAVRRA